MNAYDCKQIYENVDSDQMYMQSEQDENNGADCFRSSYVDRSSVLIFSRDRVMAEYLHLLLHVSYPVVVTDDESDLEKIIADVRFDAAIIDFTHDSIQHEISLMQAIESKSRTNDIPIIAVIAEDHFIHYGMRLHQYCNEFVIMPMNRDRLLRSVERATCTRMNKTITNRSDNHL